MADITIPRDGNGIHVLTAAQAASLAALSLPDGRHNPDGMAVLDAIWSEDGDATKALAVWVMRHAPVVTAAVDYVRQDMRPTTHVTRTQDRRTALNMLGMEVLKVLKVSHG